MKRILVLVALSALVLLATGFATASSPARVRAQVVAVDLSVLRAEWEKGWQHSFYVHLGDTYSSFVTHQLDHLAVGEYIDLVPAIRSEVESVERHARGSTWSGGWEPVGWGECDRELLVLKRRGR